MQQCDRGIDRGDAEDRRLSTLRVVIGPVVVDCEVHGVSRRHGDRSYLRAFWAFWIGGDDMRAGCNLALEDGAHPGLTYWPVIDIDDGIVGCATRPEVSENHD